MNKLLTITIFFNVLAIAILTGLLAACTINKPQETVYYLRIDGNDLNSGKDNSPSEAWKTIDYAVKQLKAGDQLLVDDGVYETFGIVINELRANTEKPTIIQSINPLGASLLRLPNSNLDNSLMKIQKCTNLIIDGFEVLDTVAIESGIDVRDSSWNVTVRNCYIHDCACGGISSRLSDYLTFENNIVRDNSKRNKWNCSGISIWHPIEKDQESGYHIKILGNVSFENECDIAFSPHGFKKPTDGNGIIIDDFRNTQGGGQEGGYHARVLVQNNLSFNNGGRGINVYQSDNVDIINNTTYHNLRILSKYIDFPGEITVSNSNGSAVLNNLVVQHPEYPTKAIRFYDNDSVQTHFINNLIIGSVDLCGQTILKANNTIQDKSEQKYPQFNNATCQVSFTSRNDFRRYFGLNDLSPAINSKFESVIPKTDLEGRTRPIGPNVDMGCYEEK